ncbi:MASE4 domain-containing protein [Hafnia alvei]|nr:MASE4 domain-containing protein [Hafnia alvei]
MKKTEVSGGAIKVNKFVIFSIVLLIVLFVLFRMFGYIRLPALEALFPVSTSVTLVLNVLLALFMLMKFSVDRKHLYLVVLAFAYGISSLYLMSKLLSYPGVIFTEGGIGTNANDLAIYFIFRSASMAIFFLLSLVVYRLWNNRFINMISVMVLCTCLTIILLSTAYFVSSHSLVLSLPIVDEGSLSYQQFWSSSVGLYLVLLWGGTTCAVMWFAGVKNNFWASLSLSCIAFLGSTMLLSGSEYLTSLAW